jgi:hypothetical protein
MLSMILSTPSVLVLCSSSFLPRYLSVFPIVLLLCLFVAAIWLQLIVKLRFILIGSFSNCQYQRSPIIMLFEPV